MNCIHSEHALTPDHELPYMFQKHIVCAKRKRVLLYTRQYVHDVCTTGQPSRPCMQQTTANRQDEHRAIDVQTIHGVYSSSEKKTIYVTPQIWYEAKKLLVN